MYFMQKCEEPVPPALTGFRTSEVENDIEACYCLVNYAFRGNLLWFMLFSS